MREIARCLKTEGKLLITLPFIYHEHGSPFDFRRFSQHGIRIFLEKEFEVVEVKVQGGIGSTLGALFLHWLAWFVVESNKFIRPFLMFWFVMICHFCEYCRICF